MPSYLVISLLTTKIISCARIDYIFLNNRWELKDFKIIAHTVASDHLPLA